ncbi:Alpha/Beta hydrolase protein [Ustulina deusta]|nr:Alpha/Beta hydrolase protein [Ustulina deusta]
MLPRPSLSFTLPSIYDSAKLDCRVYHPPSLCDPSHPGVPWSGHAAVVAHPYAPLGGCFDDPIVDVTAGTLLQLGFLVATFNFRGAASSEGRTSWTSKPEQADYISVVGFLAYYVHHLHPPPATCYTSRHQLPTMLLAGYSYGAMVTTRLPPLDTILAYFATPAVHTAEADIRLRAEHLAEAQNLKPVGPTSPRRSLGVRFGGDEDSSRRSHDRGNPISECQREEGIQESVRSLLSRAKLVYRKSPRWSCQREVDNKMHHCLEKVGGDVAFQSAYLAVSPPFGLITRLATMSFPGPWSSSWMRRSSPVTDDTPLASSPTLVIYGDQDGFISYSGIREWARQLSDADTSQFHHVEVAGAGHFWTESDVVHRLRDVIGTFATKLTCHGITSAPAPQITQDLLGVSGQAQ